MYPGEFETLFRRLANLFTLETIAENKPFTGKSIKRNPLTPIWDTMDGLYDCEYIDIGDGRRVSCRFFFKKTVRIMFYVLLVEFEGRLFRIHEWQGKDSSRLNEKNINDLIRELVDSKLVNLQKEYPSRSSFKEDLKAVSSFRNVIMHVNKKLEKTLDLNLLIKRKKQLIKLLAALQQILDNMETNIDKPSNLSDQQLSELKASIGDLDKSIEDIYSVRKLRKLTGESGILIRTVGENFKSSEQYTPTYIDEERKEVKTEFAENIQKLEQYDSDPSKENKLKLLIEVGDILVQKRIVELKYSGHPDYEQVIEKLNLALEYLKKQLVKRNISLDNIRKLSKIKYGARAWLKTHNLNAKDKQLEEQLCREELEKTQDTSASA